MSEELRPCPFCGSEPTSSNEFDDEVLFYGCTKDIDCPMYDAPFVNLENWNTRPIEDALNARIAELSQAVGLITTLKPTMVMDANHPLDMVREVAEHVTARIAELEALVDKLIGVGDELANDREYQDDLVDIWHDATRDWKEREE